MKYFFLRHLVVRKVVFSAIGKIKKTVKIEFFVYLFIINTNTTIHLYTTNFIMNIESHHKFPIDNTLFFLFWINYHLLSKSESRYVTQFEWCETVIPK